MNIHDNHYYSYYSIRKKLLEKQNMFLRKAIQNQVKHYDTISRSFKRNLTSYIRENAYSLKSDNILVKEESNYSTRLFKNLNATIPLYDHLIQDLDKPFKLFVMGPGNYGKSTLINSLLGTGVKHAPENVRPLTWKIDIFEDSKNESEVTLLLRNGSRKTVSKLLAEKMIEEEEDKVTTSKKSVKVKMKTILRENKMGVSEINDLKLKLEREEVYYSDLVEAQWGVEGSSLLKKFSIVDTPGLDQVNFSGEVKKNAIDYYHKSDGVIWMLDAVSINAKNSNKMLKELEETLKKIGGRKASGNMIAVLNRMDLVDQEPGQAEEVIEEANRIFKDKFKAIIPYSSLQAFNAMRDADQQLEEISGRNKLLQCIHEVFYLNANRIQADKKNEACMIYTKENYNTISFYFSKFKENHNKYNKGIESTNKRLENELESIKSRYRNIISQYNREFKRNIEHHLEKANNIEDKVQQNEYLIKEAYKIDYLNRIYREYSSQIKTVYASAAKELIRQYNFTQYQSLDKFRQVSVSLPDIKPLIIKDLPDTWIPNAGVSAAVAGGVGMLFGPVGALIGAGAGYLFSNEMKKDGITKSVQAADDISKKFSRSFFEYAQNYFDEGRIETSSAICRSFSGIYNLHSDDHQNITNSAERVKQQCEDTLKKLGETDLRFLPEIEALIFTLEGQ